MENFKEYAQYYDLLNKDKDYQAEVDYVIALIKESNPNAKSILNLGCGTGKHDILFEKAGYHVTGVDLSQDMIAIAEDNSQKCCCQNVHFVQGDIRHLRLEESFDVVISLFHVMSYQVTNNDLNQALETAKIHLCEKGVFIFDFWYGPAVLTDLPTIRVRRLEDKTIKVTRIAEPVLNAQTNVVDVNYDIFIEDKNTSIITENSEVHPMRYFFEPELALMCDTIGFKQERGYKWMSFEEPSFNSWNTVWVVK